MPRRKRPDYEEIRVRLYYGQDDDLIEWKHGFDDHFLGAFPRAVRGALRKAIKAPETSSSPVDIDLASIRQIVEAAVESALKRYGGPVEPTPRAPDQEDEETTDLLDTLGSNLLVD